MQVISCFVVFICHPIKVTSWKSCLALLVSSATKVGKYWLAGLGTNWRRLAAHLLLLFLPQRWRRTWPSWQKSGRWPREAPTVRTAVYSTAPCATARCLTHSPWPACSPDPSRQQGVCQASPAAAVVAAYLCSAPSPTPCSWVGPPATREAGLTPLEPPAGRWRPTACWHAPLSTPAPTRRWASGGPGAAPWRPPVSPHCPGRCSHRQGSAPPTASVPAYVPICLR